MVATARYRVKVAVGVPSGNFLNFDSGCLENFSLTCFPEKCGKALMLRFGHLAHSEQKSKRCPYLFWRKPNRRAIASPGLRPVIIISGQDGFLVEPRSIAMTFARDLKRE